MSSGPLKAAGLPGLPEKGRIVVGFSGGADSTALAHWLLGQVGPGRLLLSLSGCYRTAMASISTMASLGRRATSTALRAGGLPGKKVA